MDITQGISLLFIIRAQIMIYMMKLMTEVYLKILQFSSEDHENSVATNTTLHREWLISNTETIAENDRRTNLWNRNAGKHEVDSMDDDTYWDSLLDYMDSSLSTSTSHEPLTSCLTYSNTYTEINANMDIEEESCNQNFKDDSSALTKASTSSSHPKNIDEDEISPKTFLQLKGIVVANFNMGCNFNIASTLRILLQHELAILAVQEHTPWANVLHEAEVNSIHKTFDKYEDQVIFSKMELLFIDRQLATRLRETNVHLEGCLIATKFEISPGICANFISVYGYPHSPGNRSKDYMDSQDDENTVIQKMTTLKRLLKSIINKAKNKQELIYIFGDLQDTPDGSKAFYYGNNNIKKHPLGIAQTCENMDLECTIYEHVHTMNKPIISRHGSKGG